METLQPPGALSFEGNNEENLRCCYQKFEIYLIATERVDRHEKIKCTLLLHCGGERAIEVFNTFDVQEEHKDDYTYLVEQFTQQSAVYMYFPGF